MVLTSLQFAGFIPTESKSIIDLLRTLFLLCESGDLICVYFTEFCARTSCP